MVTQLKHGQGRVIASDLAGDLLDNGMQEQRWKVSTCEEMFL